MEPSTPSNDASLARKLGLGAGALMAGRVVSAACGLIQIPVILKGLGTEAFGLWVAMVGLLWTLASVDGGIGFALQNRLSAALATGREDEASALLRRGFSLLTILAAGLAALGLALVFGADWSSWLGVPGGPLAQQASTAALLLVVAGAASLPATLGARVATAVEETWITGLWTTVSSCLTLGIVLCIRPSFTGYFAAACLPLLLPQLLTWLHLRRRHAWLHRHVSGIVSMRGFARESLLFFSPQLGAAFAGSFVPSLVASHAGLQAAAVYGILHRIYSLGQQLLTLALQPVWPAYARALAVGDHRLLARLLRQSSLGCLLGFILPTALGTLLVPYLVRLWLGPGAPDIAPLFLWTVCAWNLLLYAGQPPAILLNGTGRLGGIAVISWLWMALAWLFVSFPALKDLHAAGVLLCLGLAYTLAYLPAVWLQALSLLKRPLS